MGSNFDRMKYIIVLLLTVFLFTQCKSKVEVYPTSTYDTLGIQWMTIDRANITYYFQGAGAKGASIYTDLHEEAYQKLQDIFKAQLPQKLRFFVWTDWSMAEQRLNRPLGFAVPTATVCHVRANQTLGHEITHILSYWSKGVIPSSYAKFIDEGVSVAFDLRGDDKIGTAKNALKNYTIKSITEIWSGKYRNGPEDLLYPVGGAFIEYLYNLNQPDKFFALLKNQTQNDAETIYGKDELDKMIKDFDRQLGL